MLSGKLRFSGDFRIDGGINGDSIEDIVKLGNSGHGRGSSLAHLPHAEVVGNRLNYWQTGS